MFFWESGRLSAIWDDGIRDDEMIMSFCAGLLA
jgi:hypothetical protein